MVLVVALCHSNLKSVAMAKTLPYENLDVDASEKNIQFLLTYSKVTASIRLENQLEELEFLYQN
ncbi:MAG: hypothetical protein DA445_05015 [Bacteroidetes bacterium]|jgi:hypothetical protein|nr:MAG: hypothetical protein DA396_05060 [Bacteroidota bacterium]PTM01307.1 MAG: hypothetical protein DA440_00040 [Bacteroidota bacterium]PTM16729.1 MAG: hypothetical protein DA445_05015 [Bacteroidota bacterium]PTM18627.1 MAG: hypothetical protein DA444_03660 [Bacteroidota bacterium]